MELVRATINKVIIEILGLFIKDVMALKLVQKLIPLPPTNKPGPLRLLVKEHLDPSS